MNTTIPAPAVALVVAAGSGVRLGAGMPKALVRLSGRSLVARSLDSLAAGGVAEAVVVAPAGHLVEFEKAVTDSPIPVRVVPGGGERQDSVQLGLSALDSVDGPVLVHDAARPLVPARVVSAVIEAVRGGAVAVVPVVAVTDSIRRLTDEGSEMVDRSTLRAVQTPQGFDPGVLTRAHELVRERGLLVTDDAAACEAAGHPVTLVAGAAESMKITTPADLRFAEALLGD
ncbi:2-C-methyl-D-erythritol 4-phosphate cytidylyltransferase [Naumannella halotolerans]|uniref:2-C-methyl-D-erythritol 4-phosphate cytidylyltransferase n=1 Tax=Naumannella halotolerans TaxID=993414 RepID=UPI001AAFED33|nr:2-C-methyl-D-erythritol 4-phosphate cytidylyltransferase [Naumannella halotolerans]